jgi:phage/plasmid primase-like uncharacterized protein
MSAPSDSEVKRQFLDAMMQRGLVLHGEPIADGRMHRCNVAGKRGKSGWGDGRYVLHLNGAIPAGGFQNFITGGEWVKWCFDLGRDLDDIERAELDRFFAESKRRNAEQAALDAARARGKAQRLWGSAPAAIAMSHQYLIEKGVQPHGLRIKYGCLLMPIYDINGTLHNLQFIRPDGSKRYLKGGRTEGCFYRIPGDNEAICIGEGFSTAATVHENTGHTVIAGCYAGNLPEVAKAVADNYPDGTKIVITADDDWQTKGNPGIVGALKASRAVRGVIAVPAFGMQRGGRDTDFNDWVRLGADAAAVRRAIEQALKADALLVKRITQDPPSACDPEMVKQLKELKHSDAVAYARLRQVLYRARINVGDIEKQIKALEALATAGLNGANNNVNNEPPYWSVKPWDEPVDTGILLGAVAGRLRRHVIMTEEQKTACALWVMFTWVHDIAQHSPLLVITSPEANSGKTTLTGVMRFLTQRSIKLVFPSAAALFRSIEKWSPTLIADEMDDTLIDNDDVKQVFNSGWTRGDTVMRCNPDTNDPEWFSTFAPKVIAGKAIKLLDTTWSRAITIRLQRKLPGETAEKFRHDDDEGLGRLRRQLARWAADNAATLAAMKPEVIEGFSNRREDNWTVLLAIAELAGGDAKIQAWAAAKAIEGVKDPTKAVSLGTRLLAGIRAAFDNPTQKDVMLSQTLVNRLAENPEEPWQEYRSGKPLTQRQLARLLRDYQIFSKSVRVSTSEHGRGYERKQFEDASERYLGQEVGQESADGQSGATPPDGDQEHAHAPGPEFPENDLCQCDNSTSSNTYTQKRSVTDPSLSQIQNGVNQLNEKDCHGVTDRKPENPCGEEIFGQDGPDPPSEANGSGTFPCAHCGVDDNQAVLIFPGEGYPPDGIWLHRQCLKTWLDEHRPERAAR